MSLLFVLETWGAVLLICAIVIGIALLFAPEGSEDETGLHLSETNSPQEVKLARPNYGPSVTQAPRAPHTTAWAGRTRVA